MYCPTSRSLSPFQNTWMWKGKSSLFQYGYGQRVCAKRSATRSNWQRLQQISHSANSSGVFSERHSATLILNSCFQDVVQALHILHNIRSLLKRCNHQICLFRIRIQWTTFSPNSFQPVDQKHLLARFPFSLAPRVVYSSWTRITTSSRMIGVKWFLRGIQLISPFPSTILGQRVSIPMEPLPGPTLWDFERALANHFSMFPTSLQYPFQFSTIWRAVGWWKTTWSSRYPLPLPTLLLEFSLLQHVSSWMVVLSSQQIFLLLPRCYLPIRSCTTETANGRSIIRFPFLFTHPIHARTVRGTPIVSLLTTKEANR